MSIPEQEARRLISTLDRHGLAALFGMSYRGFNSRVTRMGGDLLRAVMAGKRDTSRQIGQKQISLKLEYQGGIYSRAALAKKTNTSARLLEIFIPAAPTPEQVIAGVELALKRMADPVYQASAAASRKRGLGSVAPLEPIIRSPLAKWKSCGMDRFRGKNQLRRETKMARKIRLGRARCSRLGGLMDWSRCYSCPECGRGEGQCLGLLDHSVVELPATEKKTVKNAMPPMIGMETGIAGVQLGRYPESQKAYLGER